MTGDDKYIPSRHENNDVSFIFPLFSYAKYPQVRISFQCAVVCFLPLFSQTLPILHDQIPGFKTLPRLGTSPYRRNKLLLLLTMSLSQQYSGAETKEVLRGNNNAEDIRMPAEPGRSTKTDQPLAARPTPLTWFLVCVGLYLGALLYGKKLSTLSLTRPLNESRPRHDHRRRRPSLGI
jgi:hypothetical protein